MEPRFASPPIFMPPAPSDLPRATRARTAAGRIATAYLVVALLWIWLSDATVLWLGLGEFWFLAGVWKGTAFVVASAALLFWLVRREVAAVRASDSLLRATFEQAAVGITHVALDGRFLCVNRRFAEIAGYSPAELETRTFQSITHPDDLPTDEELQAPLRAGTTDNYSREKRYLRPDGSAVWVNVTVSLRRSDAGEPLHLISVVEDITARKRAEAQTAEARRMLLLVLDTIPAGVFWKDRDSRYLGCNQRVAVASGFARPEDIVGKTDGELPALTPADAAFFVRKDREVMESGEAQSHIQEPMTQPDGRVIWLDTTKVPMRDADGRVIGLLGTWEDVTERKRLELQLRHQEMLLREAAEVAHVGGWGFDPTTLELEWTPEVYRIHDLPEAAAPDVRTAIDFYVAEDRERIAAAVTEATERGTPFDLELRIRSARGVLKWVRATCHPIVESGRVVRVRGAFQDITDRKRLEEQFRQAQKMEAVGRLAGGVAHDFNNLLTVINGYADLLLAGMPTDDGNRQAVLAMRDAGERAAGLTAQLLAFGRKAVIAPRPLDLREVLTGAERLLRRLAGTSVQLTVVTDPVPCRIEADPNQLDQVLLNLVVNARDAMPGGGRLTVACRPLLVHVPEPTAFGELSPGRYVELRVTDTGDGMTDDVRANIFEPFFTTKGLGKGTGLGLAVVHGIVQQAGGRIQVASEVGAGTSFRLLFPEAVAAHEATAPVPDALGTETILLVEDEAAVRDLCRMALESQGYRVLVAASGCEALGLLDDLPDGPDLLVSDLMMPEMNGWELASAIRGRHPRVRILFISGYTNNTTFSGGVADTSFLQKPFTPLGLARKVREVLDAVAEHALV